MTLGNNKKSEIAEYYSVDGLASTATAQCPVKIQDFPVPSRGNTAVLVGERHPVFCGGLFADIPSNLCYELLDDFTWKFIAHMKHARFHPSSIAVNDTTMLVIGGRKAHYTSEYVSLNGQVQMGPNLPRPIYAGCFVKIDDNKAIMIGGSKGRGTEKLEKSTFFFNIQQMNWKRGPDVAISGLLQSCGLLLDGYDSSSKMVFKVGHQKHDAGITEMLPLNANKWIVGPRLRGSPTHGPHMISTLDQKV